MCSISAGVPQGSVLEPALFTAYVSQIGHLIESLGTEFHAYADDMQIYKALMTDTEPGLERLSKCTIALQHWFWKNDILNPDKSKMALYRTRPGLKGPGMPSSISIAGCAINVFERIKILSITLDATLSFDDHITSVVRTCNFHMHALCHICCCISQDITNTIACSIIGSRLDYLQRTIVRCAGENSKSSMLVDRRLARHSSLKNKKPIWNGLPATVRAAPSIGSFWIQLKTNLYRLSPRVTRYIYSHFCSFQKPSAL